MRQPDNKGNLKMENINTKKLDEALETALQMPAVTAYDRFQRAVSVANVRCFYLRSAGDSSGACRVWDEEFNLEMAGAE